MTLERIENHILEKARAEAEALTAETREEAARVVTAAREAADAQYASAVEQLDARLKLAFEQETGKLQGRHRMELLRLKSKVLDDVFRRAADKLLFSDEYWKLTRTRLRELAGQKGRILCRAEHRDTLAKMIDELNPDLGRDGKMPPLADEPAPIPGGFVFQGDGFDLDFSLDSQMRAFREKVLPELVARAFPET